MLYHVEHLGKVLSDDRLVVARIEHVGDFGVLGVSLSRGRGHNVPPCGVGVDYVCYLHKLLGVGKGASAELDYFG